MRPPLGIDRHFRTVMDGLTDGVLIEQLEHVLYVNPAYAQMLGYPSTTELSHATIRDIAHPDDLDRLRWFGTCRAEGRPAPTRYRFRAQGRNGRCVTFDAAISTARVGSDVLITTIVREVVQPPDVRRIAIPGTDRLSEREHEIIEGVLQGMRSKEIALKLDISEKTVFTHRSRAYRKLSIRSDRELFRLAADLGLL